MSGPRNSAQFVLLLLLPLLSYHCHFEGVAREISSSRVMRSLTPSSTGFEMTFVTTLSTLSLCLSQPHSRATTEIKPSIQDASIDRNETAARSIGSA